jgi:hypothetical protein
MQQWNNLSAAGITFFMQVTAARFSQMKMYRRLLLVILLITVIQTVSKPVCHTSGLILGAISS